MLKRGAGEEEHKGKEGEGRREEKKEDQNTSSVQNSSKHTDLYFKDRKLLSKFYWPSEFEF